MGDPAVSWFKNNFLVDESSLDPRAGVSHLRCGFGGFTVFPPSLSHSASPVEVVPGLFLHRERREMQGPRGLPPAMSQVLSRVLGE